MQPAYFTEDVNLSKINSTMTFINFSNKVMSSIYKLIFCITLPRMTEEIEGIYAKFQ